MGIALPSLILILDEYKQAPFSGTVLQMGRQDIYFDWEILQNCARQLRVPLRKPTRIGLKPNQWAPGVKTIDDITLFEALGFDHVKSVDASSYEQADFICDFNLPVPETMHGKFDVLYDGGSLEHIFHLPNAMSNITALLKPGGRILHHAPTHNFVDHGFYSFSPTFFFDYYEANHFEKMRLKLAGSKLPFRHNDIPKIYDYHPGALEAYSVGGFTKEKFDGCELFMSVFSATKGANSRGDVIPVQRRYRQWWANANATPLAT